MRQHSTGGTVDNLTVNEDSGFTSLGLLGLTHSPGGGADETSQTLTYDVTVIPSPAFGSIYLSDGVTVVGTGNYSLADIQGMQFRPAAGQSGVTFFEFQVSDDGGTDNGGDNTTNHSIQITVDPVNDAPVLDTAATLSMSDVQEDDFNPAGDTVQNIIDSDGVDRITDVDTGDPEGIAVYQVDDSNGTWQYDTGGGWTNFGPVSPTAITLLDPTALIRFVPNADFNGTATFLYHAWDQTQGTNGQTGFDMAANGTGGTTAFSVDGDTATVNIIPSNDAPEIDLDADDSSGTTGVDYSTSFAAGGGPVLVTDGATLDDVDGTIQTLTVRITNIQDGASEVLTFVGNGNIGSAYTPATGSLTLINGGSATNAMFENLLNSITYENISSSPDLTPRTIEFVASDGVENSIVATTTINMSGDSQVPVVINNLGSTVDEAGLDVIDNLELQSSDLQPASSINYTVTSATNNGFLALASAPTSPITSFTQADIDAGNLIYVHNGTETLADSFTFTVDDGQGNSVAGQVFNITVTPVNDAPINFHPASIQTVAEDGTLVFSVGNANSISVGDIDAGGAVVQTTLTASNGQLTLSRIAGLTFTVGDGSSDSTMTFQGSIADINAALDGLSYSPTGDYNGSASLVVLTNDLGNTGSGGNQSDLDTINIDVAAENDAPEFRPSESLTLPSVNEGATNPPGTTVADMLASDSGDSVIDPDAGAVEGIAVTGADHPNGTWQYSLDGNSWTNFSSPSSGNATLLDATAQLRFIPDTDYNGAASLSFYAWDQTDGNVNGQTGVNIIPGQGGTGAFSTAPNFATLNVTPINDAPIVDLDADNSTSPGLNYNGSFVEGGGPVAIADVDSMISDVDNTTVSWMIVRISNLLDGADESLSVTLPDATWISFYNDTNGELSIVPGPGSTNADWETVLESIRYDNTSADPDTTTRIITIEVDDGTDSNSPLAESHISIGSTNQAPVVDSVESTPLSYTENAGPIAITATLELSDVDDTQIESATVVFRSGYVLGEDSLSFADFGNITGSFNASTGTLTLSGTDSVANYEAALRSVAYENLSDSPLTGTRTIDFSAFDGDGWSAPDSRDVDINPVNDAPDSHHTATFADEDFSATVSLSGTDVDGSITAFQVTQLPNDGTLYLDGAMTNPVLANTIYSANPGGTLQLYFQPNADWSGDTTLEFIAQDDQGAWDATPGSYNIRYNPINDAPLVGTNTGATVSEGSIGNQITTAMLNEADVDDDPADVTYTLLSNVANGTLSRNGVELVVGDQFKQADVDAGIITYDHDGSDTTTDGFDFSLSDGGEDGSTPANGTFNWTITPVNDAPTVNNNVPLTVSEGGVIGIAQTSLEVVDAESNPGQITYNVVSAPNSGQLELTTSPGVAATSFTQDDINSGRLIYIHDGSETTTDSFDFIAIDHEGGALPVATFDLAVTAVNDAPDLGENSLAISEGGTTTITSANLNASDPDNASLTFDATNISGGQFESTLTPGSPITSFTQAQINAGEIVFVHDGGEAAPSYEITVSDGQLSDGPSLAIIDFTNVNDEQLLTSNLPLTLNEGGRSVISSALLAAADVDNPPAELVYSITNAPASGEVLVNGVGANTFSQADINAGAVEFSHDGTETTADSFDFTLDDGAGAKSSGTFLVVVNQVNDAPTGQSDNYQVDVSGQLTIAAPDGLLQNDVDMEGDPMAASLASAPANGTIMLNADGSFVYNPVAGFSGVDTFSYKITDGADTSGVVTVTIEVGESILPPPPPPTIDDDPTTTNEVDEPGNSDSDDDEADETVKPDVVPPSPQSEPPENRSRRISATSRDDGGDFDATSFQAGGSVEEQFNVFKDVLKRSAEKAITDLAGPEASVGFNAVNEAIEVNAALLFQRWDALRDEIDPNAWDFDMSFGAATVVGGSLTIGYVLWTLRGGYLMASVMSSLPVWRTFDPLPILKTSYLGGGKADNDEEEETLASMVAAAAP